ncbi:O-succinylbenzoic acid--CoA ligase [Herbihabitans rhizosphaerae]|uniref:O-succinylbenzoic acid--CoA ligase n=1 Tax=Herbihabitans rhizosphaerae TaxID=1872711 RepID=A0A4Q7L7A9_9PSEU|nr:o-succinylbenzoate--CoA ligase [Herbihabitans rhizosphaerae]RZS44521.1 O-succinylbenzoic acid--CoA ligase [Herbihabitans rhizosphaerae]
MREVLVDGRATSAQELHRRLRAALDGGEAVLPLATDDPRLPALRARLAPDEPAEPGTAVIVATSGSTGVPKGVLLSAAALRASADATHARLGGPGAWLLSLPANHIAGVQVLVRSIVAGVTPGIAHLAGGFRSRAFVEAASDVLAHDGPRYTALVPTQLTRLLDEGGAGLAALRSFDAVLLGGASITPALMARAGDAGVAVRATYGMTETAGGCVYDHVSLDGVHIRLSDRDGDTGVIEIAGPMLASGYRLSPKETAMSFVDGWLRTTDIGRLRGDWLEVLGRADDVINTGGVKVAPVLVERVLTDLPGVAEACVVGLEDPEWGQRVTAAVVPADRDAPPKIDALRDGVRAALGDAAVPKLIRFLDELPLTGPGKVDRAAVRRRMG